ncbi:MAG TPA: SAP domain-containing protein [Amycolatopsis sp.]|nr:SAP domain-containing protein [Amycolatopsis sp.]
MTLWICIDCTCRYSVGAKQCPQCQSTNYTEEHPRGPYTCAGCDTAYRLKIFTCPRCRSTDIKETPMAKITHGTGPTNVDDPASGWDPDNVVTPEDGGDPYTEGPNGERYYEPQPVGNDGEHADTDDEAPALPPADGEPSTEDNAGAEHDQSQNGDDTSDPVAEARALYEAATVEELKAELRNRDRDLSVTGNKPELVDRLLADDAARAAETKQDTE